MVRPTIFIQPLKVPLWVLVVAVSLRSLLRHLLLLLVEPPALTGLRRVCFVYSVANGIYACVENEITSVVI